MLNRASQAAIATGLLALANVFQPQLWAAPDVQEPRLIREVPWGLSFFSEHPALSSTGKVAATGEQDGFTAVDLWDVRKTQQSISLTGHKPKKRIKQVEAFQTELAFSANGQTLVACDTHGANDGRCFLRIWTDLASDSPPIQIPLSHSVFAVSPDGHLVAGVRKGDKAVGIWDTKTGDLVTKLPYAMKVAPGLPGELMGLVFTPDGKELVLYSSNVDELRTALTAFEVKPATATPTAAAGRVIAQMQEGFDWSGESSQYGTMGWGSKKSMSFLNGGKTLVTLSNKETDKRTHDAQWQIHYWDMTTGGEQRPAAAFSANRIHTLRAMSPYGNTLSLTTKGDPRIRVLDLATGKTRAEIALPAKTEPFALFVDATGKYLGAGTYPGPRSQIWELGPTQGESQPANTESGPSLPHP